MRNRMNLGIVIGLSSLAALACTGQIDSSQPENVDPNGQQAPAGDVDPDPIVVGPVTPPTPLLQAQVEDILNRNCGACHGAEGTLQAGMDYIEDVEQLIESGRLVPGDADGSLIVQRVRNGSMPPVGIEPRPTNDEIETIATFVDALPRQAPANGEGVNTGLALSDCSDPPIGFDELFELMQADLLAMDADDRPFARYLSLSNRLNAGRCAAQLESDRWALYKLLNSLSSRPRVTLPTAIDELEILYRIDLRDYGWDDPVEVGGDNFDDGWEAIIDGTDFAVPFEGDEADLVADFAETDVPFVYVDAVVSATSAGNLYYALARVPDELDQLLDDLFIDVEDNRERGFAARAATTQSGISREERVVERHDVNLGAGRAYWQSFEGAGSAIFVSPLEIEAGETQVLYSLPNGLYAYGSFDEDGDRIEESQLLFDTLQEDFVVRSAVSCMTCHARGPLQIRDEVRKYVEDRLLRYTADEIQLVREIYPPADEMDAIIEDDRVNYQLALQQTLVPLDVPDPISAVTQRFDGRLTLVDVAADLGVEPEELDREINRLDPVLSQVADGSSLTIERNRFEALFGESLCVMQFSSRNHPADDFCRAVLD